MALKTGDRVRIRRKPNTPFKNYNRVGVITQVYPEGYLVDVDGAGILHPDDTYLEKVCTESMARQIDRLEIKIEQIEDWAERFNNL